jgi:hypothetical protein
VAFTEPAKGRGGGGEEERDVGKRRGRRRGREKNKEGKSRKRSVQKWVKAC